MTSACTPPEPDASPHSGEICLTCSDQATAVRISRLLPDGFALVDTGSGVAEVSVALVRAEVGDTILVHAGEAIGVVGR